jgi:ABC-type uncharacterized transport system substrate-binding protein
VTKPAGVPIFCNELEQVKAGATAAIGYEFGDWGLASGQKAALILAGLKPTDLPPSTLPESMMREIGAEDLKPSSDDTNAKPGK